MKTIFIWVLIISQMNAYAEILVKNHNGEVTSYSSEDYEVVKKEKFEHNMPIDYSKKKFILKSNSISFYMGRGPTHLYRMENRDTGSVTYRMEQSNLYGIGLSQRLSDSLHLEMLGLTNETIMSGFKFEFGSP